MNIVFWLIVATLILIALVILVLPLWRKTELAKVENQNQRNINIARDRLAELKANRSAGGISEEQYDEQKTELELQLNDDLDVAENSPTPSSQGRWLTYVLMIVIPCLSLGLYWALGDYGAINRANEPSQSSQEMPSAEQINGMVAKLSEKMKSEPKNLQGWLMLGRSYKVLQKYPEAVDALNHAYQLAGDNADVLLQYAEALMLANNNSWAGKPEELINKVVSKEPNNLSGLWFAAMMNAQRNDKKIAVDYLRRLETLLPADSPDKQQIHDLIANAGAEQGGAASKPSAPVTASSGEVKVNIDVSLTEELQKQSAPGDTVFIYAQALSGPKMPLAISRKHVSDLPIKVTLSDADSMLPNMKLSSFNEVRLLARVSKSASAMPQVGDLIGTVELADLDKQHDYKIVINDQVK